MQSVNYRLESVLRLDHHRDGLLRVGHLRGLRGLDLLVYRLEQE